jgi:aminoglycoside/choline kinase family phosphotransferase
VSVSPDLAANMRDRLIENFLQAHDWHKAERTPLAGDASFRRYIRLTRENEAQAMLMDAPPPQEDVRPFLAIADHLSSLGLSAPRILARDEAAGLLLLEDLGDATYTRLLADGSNETALYRLATDTLIALHRRFRRGTEIPPYDEVRLLDEVALLVDWFLPALRGADIPPELRDEYLELWREVLPVAQRVPDSLVLRDYHVDNLLWLPNRADVAACGLLDFQDAVIGPVTYDLVSLFEDARRDVPQDMAQGLIAYYLDAFPDIDRAVFQASYAVMGAQRSAKIIGIFTRLDRRDGKPVYLHHIPRVFRWLWGGLEHPALCRLRAWFEREIPKADRIAPPCVGR